MAYGAATDWRQFADAAAQQQTRVQWAELAPAVGGMTRNRYSKGVLRVGISLNSFLREESTQVVAAVLAHETYHAATVGNSGGREACLQNEVAAHRWQAYVWQEMPRPGTSTVMVDEQDRVANLVNSGQIDSYVRNSPAYQWECAVR